MGHDTGWIVRRSSVLFVLTSAASVGTAIAAGCLALAGLGGPRDVLHGGLPVLAGCATIGVVVAVVRRSRAPERRASRATLTGQLLHGAGDAGAMLARPTWRVAGAVGYLWFDIAALWATFVAIGGTPPLVALVLGYLIGFLAYALPIPGGIGVLDAGLAGGLTLYGAPAVHATAAVLVYHAVALWVPGAGGLVAYVAGRHRLGSAGETTAG